MGASAFKPKGGDHLLVVLLAILPATLWAGDYDSVCGGVLDAPPPSADSAPGAADAQQKYQYCQAAKSAQEGAQADSAGYKVWAAVGVVCAHACTASIYGGPMSEYECSGASIGGAAADAAITKNFMGALSGIGGAAMNLANQKSEAPAAEGQKADKKDTAACMSAATAAQQSYAKYDSMKNNNATVDGNLKAAAAVAGATQGTSADTGHAPMQESGSGHQAEGSGNADGSTGLGMDGRAAGCGPNMTPAQILQCGVAKNPDLPPFIARPGFAREFQKDAGLPLGDFLGKNEPAGNLMAAGMSNGLSPAQGAKIASALNELGQAVGSSAGVTPADGVYYTGGGGARPSGDGMGDMGALMQGLMDKLNPGGKKDAAQGGVGAVIFANQTRAPAAVAEDRKLSIFDRVTYRYYFVGRRIVLQEGSNP